MRKKFSGSAVPRHYVFVLQDGTFVIQWAEKRVQDILTGKILPFSYTVDFGHAITDGELHKLKIAGRVEHFTRRYVWIYALPERGRYDRPLTTLDRAAEQVRVYYIATTLPEAELETVVTLLPTLNLTHEVKVSVREHTLAIVGSTIQPFTNIQDAEEVLQELRQADPGRFSGASIGVMEMALRTNGDQPETDSESTTLNLDALIQSQSDTTVTEGKQAVIINPNDEERGKIRSMMTDALKMTVYDGETGREMLPIIEDVVPDVIILDLALPDTHGWTLIKKIREIPELRRVCLLVISDEPSDMVFAIKVVRVAAFLSRPLNFRKLREKLWLILRASNGCETGG